MRLPTICEEPGCGGKVDQVKKKCLKCHVLYDGNPEAQAFLGASQGDAQGVVRVAGVLSSLSRQEPINERPVQLADLFPPPAERRRSEPGRTMLSIQSTLGGGKVKMPPVAHVDRLAQINLELRTPLSQRVCSNVRREMMTRIACEEDEPAGPDGLKPRTRLYWKAPAGITKLPPDCRLEEVIGADGEKTTMFVPDKGFCRKCGTPFNFLPLEAGTKVDQLRIEGQFMCGGDGMLYHATDEELGLPRVIKALHDGSNARGAKIASQEVGALVLLQDQPGILRICGFKQFEGRLLIVLEWLDGATLFDVRLQNKGPLPLEVGLSYLMAAIAAVRVGHDNTPRVRHPKPKHTQHIVLAPGDQMKLIDYGGCKIDGKGDLVRTIGYSAPELYAKDPINEGRSSAPSPASVCWVCLGVVCFLSLNFTLTGWYAFTLPPASEVPEFAEFESLYRFLLRMTAINPDARMTMDEAYNAASALRDEVIALKERRAMPYASTIFVADQSRGIDLSAKALPALNIDPRDEAAPQVARAMESSDPSIRRELLEKARIQSPESMEVRLRLAALDIDCGNLEAARGELEQAARKDPYDGRVLYLMGLVTLAEGNIEQATRCFDACYSVWPGETAIKLANAWCAELSGNHARASRFYETVAWIDPDCSPQNQTHPTQALKVGDRATALEAYGRVRRTSWAFKKAVIGRVQALGEIISTTSASGVGLTELQEAAEVANLLIAEGESYESCRVRAEVFKAAIAALRSRSLSKDKSVLILGVPLVKWRLRRAAAAALVKCASFVGDRSERIALVDESRQVAGFSFL